MKFNTLLLTGAAVFALASCSSQSTKTIINGEVGKDVEKVHVSLNSSIEPIDTTIAVKDGKFSIELPVDKLAYGMVRVGHKGFPYVPDGTTLNLFVGDTIIFKSESKNSIHDQYKAFQRHVGTIQNDLEEEYKRIDQDASLDNEQKQATFSPIYDKAKAELIAYCKEALKENPDNFVGMNALSNIHYELSETELREVVNGLSEEMKAQEFVQKIITSLESKEKTAEGAMFTDFEVETIIGHDRSMEAKPIYKTVKLSDYVGKGKYMLVDFWSPWCGPCKREMPNIKAIYEKWHGEKFDVLSIAVWEREDVRVTMNTADELGVVWNQINNAKDVPTKLYGIDGIPHIILFGPDGTILKRGLHGEELAQTVEEYLSK